MARIGFCVDCGKQIQYRSTRCLKCAAKKFGPARTTHMIGNKYRMGRHHSEGHKEKLRLLNPGRRHSEETISRISQMKMGHPVSAETRAKISVAARGRPSAFRGHHRPHTEEELAKMRGPNHWAYRDGRGNAPYPPEWKEIKKAIRRRDQGLCQHPECYLPENGRKHDCHHIDRDKRNNNSKNLILLCSKHHAETKRGNTYYWAEYYQAIQTARGIS